MSGKQVSGHPSGVLTAIVRIAVFTKPHTRSSTATTTASATVMMAAGLMGIRHSSIRSTRIPPPIQRVCWQQQVERHHPDVQLHIQTSVIRSLGYRQCLHSNAEEPHHKHFEDWVLWTSWQDDVVWRMHRGCSAAASDSVSELPLGMRMCR